MYLDINAPTEGHGVQVSFQGEESGVLHQIRIEMFSHSIPTSRQLLASVWYVWTRYNIKQIWDTTMYETDLWYYNMRLTLRYLNELILYTIYIPNSWKYEAHVVSSGKRVDLWLFHVWNFVFLYCQLCIICILLYFIGTCRCLKEWTVLWLGELSC